MSVERLHRFAWLSIAAAVATMVLKSLAWWLTGSIGLLSDALESLVNLAAALVVLAMLAVATRPPDEDHAFGHGKAEYFAGGLEGVLILVAAAGIAITAIDRLLQPRALTSIDLGLVISAVATAINYGVAQVLLRAGRRYHSIALEADGEHLMTDVITSVGVFAGVAAVWLTDWWWLDPLVALLVAANIVRIGIALIGRSTAGLMDSSLPTDQHRAVVSVLEKHRADGLDYHALRTRQAGQRAFVSVHLLVPGTWTVAEAHEHAEAVDAEIRQALPRASVFTHVEPIDDPRSWDDVSLDR